MDRRQRGSTQMRKLRETMTLSLTDKEKEKKEKREEKIRQACEEFSKLLCGKEMVKLWYTDIKGGKDWTDCYPSKEVHEVFEQWHREHLK